MRQQHAGGDPAAAHQAEEDTEGAGAEAELFLDHQGEHGPGGGGGEEERRRSGHGGTHDGRVADEAHAGAHGRDQVFARQG